MRLRALALGAVAATLFAVPTIANAAWGQTTGSVNMRTCASTQCAKITTLPAGAPVWVNGSQGGWYSVTFNGRQGFVSGNYVATANIQPGPRFGNRGPNWNNRGPRFGDWRGQPPRSGYWRNPYWDDRHQAWYDGRRWYRNGIWYNDPSGFSFGFSFGG
jgi:uncharacterized protein YraI